MMFDIFGIPQVVHVITMVAGIIHVIRSQRSWWWILLMLWTGAIGFGIYFFMEWLPEIRRGKPGMPRKESNRKQIKRLLDEVDERCPFDPNDHVAHHAAMLVVERSDDDRMIPGT